jgi:hypothetical protein
MKQYTVILGASDNDNKCSMHLVEARGVQGAITEALKEACTDWAVDAVVIAGHHCDLRKTSDDVCSPSLRRLQRVGK